MTLLNADGAVASESGSESGSESESESGSESEWESDFEVEGENVENYTVNDFEIPAGTANENENRNFINEINNIPDNNNNFILNRFQVSVNPINS